MLYHQKMPVTNISDTVGTLAATWWFCALFPTPAEMPPQPELTVSLVRQRNRAPVAVSTTSPQVASSGILLERMEGSLHWQMTDKLGQSPGLR